MTLTVENIEKQEIVVSPMKKETDEDLGALLESAEKHLYPNYAQPPLVMEKGKGSVLWDSSGKRYVDFFAGIAVSTVGHAHPKLTEALAQQAEKLIHVSNYYYTAPNLRLAEKLCELTGFDRAFFCNSGTEANEAALKLTRRHFFDQGKADRDVVIAFDNSFHGRTIGALTATGQPKYRTGFGPIGGVVHAPYGDLEAVASLMNGTIAGIIVEPIQGEGGVIPAPAGFLQGLRKMCDDSGALLISDEIQTGIGRTGRFLGTEHAGVRADVVTLAKALGGGVPVGAMLCTEALAGALPPGSHGTTFGGNPFASTAALAVLDVVEKDGLVARAQALGAHLDQALSALVEKHPLAQSHRGVGLLQGLVLSDPSQGGALLGALRDAGLLVTFAGGTTIRVTPPLTITDAELEEGLGILDQVLGDFS